MSDAPTEITVIEMNDLATSPPEVGSMWPAHRPADDRISMQLADAVIIHGTPHQIAEWFADGMMKARTAEREMLAKRVTEGRQRQPQATTRGALDVSEGFSL